MKHIVVVGGGVAGLTAGALLSKKGYKVTLLESSPKLGGRAYSFQNHFKSTDGSLNPKIIDNGQHLLMGCYPYFLSFLKTIGSYEKLNIPTSLSIFFHKPDKIKSELIAPNFLYPFNLAIAILRYKSITFTERLLAIYFILKLPIIAEHTINDMSIYDWLVKNNQTENAITNLWSVIAIGALNCDLKLASAIIFRNILIEMFLKGNFNSKLIVPETGLSDLIAEPAMKFIKNNCGAINLSESLQSVEITDNRVSSISTNKRTINNFDSIVFALPPFSLAKIKNIEKIMNIESVLALEWSPILSVHFLLKTNLIKNRFVGLLNQSVQWVFEKNNIASVVISNSTELLNKSNDEIFEIVYKDLNTSLGLKKEDIIDYKILHDKRSTFIPNSIAESVRPNIKTDIANAFLIGDWVNTDLPATLESAAKSGTILTRYL